MSSVNCDNNSYISSSLFSPDILLFFSPLIKSFNCFTIVVIFNLLANWIGVSLSLFFSVINSWIISCSTVFNTILRQKGFFPLIAKWSKLSPVTSFFIFGSIPSIRSIELISELPIFNADSIKLFPDELITSSVSFFSSSSLSSLSKVSACLNKFTFLLSFDEFIILKNIFSWSSSFRVKSKFSPFFSIKCSHKELSPSPTKCIIGVVFPLFWLW